MLVFTDTEFVENGNRMPLQPISVAFVTEDGREFYGINEECLSNVMRTNWLRLNVRPSLPIREDVGFTSTAGAASIYEWDPGHPDYPRVLPLEMLAQQVAEFLAGLPGGVTMWSYYGAYDHVIVSQLFGTMNELPSYMPMWSHELMQLKEQHPDIEFPPQSSVAHNALEDARWNKLAYETLMRGSEAIGLDK